jgi:iron complex outermembrane receptor protein
LSYRLNSNWKFRLEAINLFDDPKRQYRPSRDNFAEINVYGPRVFAGVEFKY